VTRKGESPGKGWLSRQQMADAFDVVVGAFDGSYRRYFPKAAVKVIGGRLYFHARTGLEAWAAANRKAQPGMGETDPLLVADGDSPGLERYRNAKADIAELDKAERIGELVPREQLEPVLMKSAGTLRRAGDLLARQFGNDAAGILNQAVDEWELICERLLNGNDSDNQSGPQAGDGDTDAKAPDDATVR
jgi:hypothetical protein